MQPRLLAANLALALATVACLDWVAHAQPAAEPRAAQLGPVLRPTAPSADPTAPTDLDPVFVRGERSYRVEDAGTATKLDLPLRDIPQSIQVIPRQVIEDRQVLRINELADNVAGVQQFTGFGGVSTPSFQVRGFNLFGEHLRNGFRDFGLISPQEMANIERVEFLKGPAAVLYGSSGSFGAGTGLINVVTKKPVPIARTGAELVFGSYSFYRGTLDIGGPLTANASLSYRLNAAYENDAGFKDFGRSESVFVAPALAWKIDERTDLNLAYEYQRFNNRFQQAFPLEVEFLDLPPNRFLGEPAFDQGKTDSNALTAVLEHRFAEGWKFRQGFNMTLLKYDNRQTFPFFLLPDRRTLPRLPLLDNEGNENYALQNEIFGKFDTGSIQHNVLFGVELSRYRYRSDVFAATAFDEIDIYNPVYGDLPTAFVPFALSETGSDNIGVYLQDFVELTPNLKLLAGVRYDYVYSLIRDRLSSLLENQQYLNNFSPRAGLVWQPGDTTSLYFSYSTAFVPQFNTRTRGNTQLRPTTGRQFEFGVKQDLIPGQLSANLAFFDITRQNVVRADLENPLFGVQTGEQKSRGIELDITGRILPGWNVIATYALTDAYVSRDDIVPVGDRLFNTPLNRATLWTTYFFARESSLAGLGLGLGLYYAGQKEASLPNTFELPAVLRADAAIYYAFGNYRLAVNFKNLTSVRDYTTEGLGLYPNPPLTVLGTLSLQF
ncbi:TonB-dependent siderophore receptor [Gloeobacter morelensis]|uniref:TonB-dependent siderophore receptor n=1 Tax=Gloeobacter morelensis MG652769 TaxID=2781736 RepID=A0ABY3PM46_9CYAN|nr:TonB-dependent siderophore receptor [Gloeobacter morelensis]UFP94753.1 TonB-dependent siderophore receptor [Gloeobacter morelensis MG652769]